MIEKNSIAFIPVAIQIDIYMNRQAVRTFEQGEQKYCGIWMSIGEWISIGIDIQVGPQGRSSNSNISPTNADLGYPQVR